MPAESSPIVPNRRRVASLVSEAAATSVVAPVGAPASADAAAVPEMSARLALMAERRENRAHVLEAVYDAVGADVWLDLDPSDLIELGLRVGLSEGETEAALYYHWDHGHLEGVLEKTGAPVLHPVGHLLAMRITARGVDAVEHAALGAGRRST